MCPKLNFDLGFDGKTAGFIFFFISHFCTIIALIWMGVLSKISLSCTSFVLKSPFRVKFDDKWRKNHERWYHLGNQWYLVVCGLTGLCRVCKWWHFFKKFKITNIFVLCSMHFLFLYQISRLPSCGSQQVDFPASVSRESLALFHPPLNCLLLLLMNRMQCFTLVCCEAFTIYVYNRWQN